MADLPKEVTLNDLPNELVGDSNITLRWDRVEGAPNYRVYQMIDSRNAEWERVKTTTDDTCVIRLERGKCYSFKVVALNEHGEGKEGNIKRVKVLGKISLFLSTPISNILSIKCRKQPVCRAVMHG